MTQEVRKKKFDEWLKLLDIYRKYAVQFEIVFGGEEVIVEGETGGGGLGSNPPPPPPPPPFNP